MANRLLPFDLRWLIVPPSTGETLNSYMDRQVRPLMTKALELLRQIRVSPSPEEASDIALIDDLNAGKLPMGSIANSGWKLSDTPYFGVVIRQDIANSHSPFAYGRRTWGDNREFVRGAAALGKAVADWPWPDPKPQFVAGWKEVIGQTALANFGTALAAGSSATKVRDWITETFWTNFDRIADSAQQMLDEKERRRARRALVGRLVPMIVGTIFSTATGGVSLALAALSGIPGTLAEARRQIDAARAAGKAEASAMEAQALAEELAANKKADELRNTYGTLFDRLGYTVDVWSILSLEKKIEVITAVSEGRDPGPPPEVTQPLPAAAAPTPAPAVPVPSVQAPVQSTGGTYQPAQIIQPTILPIRPQSSSYSPMVSAPSPSVATDTLPAATYEAMVEGVQVSRTPDLESTVNLALENSKRGDRVQILKDGVVVGLGIRGDQGIVEVPRDQWAQVLSLPHGQIVAATNRAMASTEAKSGGFPWWIILVPAAIIASK